MKSSTRQIQESLQELLAAPNPAGAIAGLSSCGIDVLPHLLPHLRADHPIAATERLEDVLKAVIASAFSAGPTGLVAREIAAFQKDLGFILKYKPYAVKASTILGYSVFLQEPDLGFSFQQHLSHKVELFHILDVHPGGYLFICSYEDWKSIYNSQTFAHWLSGSPDASLDQFKRHPAPGDLYAIERPGIVHSVIGCVLEEFATISTDFVDRLHDQNAGTPIPGRFSRSSCEERLKALRYPFPLAHATPDRSGVSRRTVVGTPIAGGHVFNLSAGPFSAARLLVEPAASTELLPTADEALSLHVTRGSGNVVIADASEAHGTSPPGMSVKQGDLLLIPPGFWYAVSGDRPGGVDVSIHGITPSTALW